MKRGDGGVLGRAIRGARTVSSEIPSDCVYDVWGADYGVEAGARCLNSDQAHQDTHHAGAGATADPQALVDALTAAGFPVAGRSRGGVRFGWPGQEWPHGPLYVPLDASAPEFDEMWTGLLGELQRAVERGDVARRVLGRIEEAT